MHVPLSYRGSNVAVGGRVLAWCDAVGWHVPIHGVRELILRNPTSARERGTGRVRAHTATRGLIVRASFMAVCVFMFVLGMYLVSAWSYVFFVRLAPQLSWLQGIGESTCSTLSQNGSGFNGCLESGASWVIIPSLYTFMLLFPATSLIPKLLSVVMLMVSVFAGVFYYLFAKIKERNQIAQTANPYYQ